MARKFLRTGKWFNYTMIARPHTRNKDPCMGTISAQYPFCKSKAEAISHLSFSQRVSLVRSTGCLALLEF